MMVNKGNWRRRLLQVGFVCLFGGALVACNLGQQSPSEPVDAQSLSLTPAVIPQGSGDQTVTETPFIISPTETPVPESLPQEEIRWIRLDNPDVEHRTQEPLTVRVRRGRLVSTVTCSWVLQGGQTGALGTPTTEEVNADLVDEVYIFTPQIAGSYSINCTGIATTSSGQQQVTAVSATFEVVAKG
jgi:hypothetical protein